MIDVSASKEFLSLDQAEPRWGVTLIRTRKKDFSYCKYIDKISELKKITTSLSLFSHN